MPRFHAHAVGLACCALLLATCTNRFCDDEVCDIYLVVDVHPDGDAWKDGEYQLTWRADNGKTHQCKFSVPVGLADCDCVFSVRPAKTATSAEFAARCSVLVKRGGGETLTCTPPAVTHFVMELYIDETPASIALHLQSDDGTSIDRTFKPSYRTYYPNGQQCGPECEEGNIDLTF